MQLRDVSGVLSKDEMFAGLFPHDSQLALAPWRLALVTLMQFAEGLSDRGAAGAARMRVDWKSALGLELEDKGFDFSVLGSDAIQPSSQPTLRQPWTHGTFAHSQDRRFLFLLAPFLCQFPGSQQTTFFPIL
jgi:hypothetical protein